MRFRKLYWVTEQLGPDGRSEVAGVYTSTSDLVQRGLQLKEGLESVGTLRLVLVQLDSPLGPLGRWVSPDFPGLEVDLMPYVQTGELTASECEDLARALRTAFVPAPNP